MAPAEAPQERPEGGRRLHAEAQDPAGAASPQGVRVVDAVATGRRTVVSDTYVLYAQRGFVNGRTGTYEIGVRISEGGGVETIVHRFFRPDP